MYTVQSCFNEVVNWPVWDSLTECMVVNVHCKKNFKWRFIAKICLKVHCFCNGSSCRVWGSDVRGQGGKTGGPNSKAGKVYVHYYSGYWFGSADVLIGVCRRHEDIMRTSSNPEMETFSPLPGHVLRTF